MQEAGPGASVEEVTARAVKARIRGGAGGGGGGRRGGGRRGVGGKGEGFGAKAQLLAFQEGIKDLWRFEGQLLFTTRCETEQAERI